MRPVVSAVPQPINPHEGLKHYVFGEDAPRQTPSSTANQPARGIETIPTSADYEEVYASSTANQPARGIETWSLPRCRPVCATTSSTANQPARGIETL